MEEKEESSSNKVSLNIDDILKRAGEFGRFQKLIDGIFCLSYLFISYQILIMYFATLTPSWKCTNTSSVCLSNTSHSGDDKSRCNMSRNDWYYDADVHFSLFTEFDVHCQHEWLLSVVSSIHFVGWGCGAVVLGWLADRFGRKKMILPSAAIMLIVGLIISFLPNVGGIIACRFVVGFTMPGVLVQGNILIAEITGNNHRPIATLIPFFFCSIGYSVLAWKAYLLQNWKMLSVMCSAPYLVVLLLFPFIPESVKWLQMNGRVEDAMLVFQRIAKWNKKDLGTNITLQSTGAMNDTDAVDNSEDENVGGGGNCRVVLQTAIQCFIWMVTTMCFFGLQMAAKELQGPLYSDFVLLSMVQFPAIIVSIYTCRKWGRKKANLIPLLLGGVACLAIAFIPAKKNFVIIRVALGILGKFFMCVTFQGLYVWTNEIFPTHLRSKGMGIVQVAARVGATSAPWVVKGLSTFGLSVPFVVLSVPSLVGSVLGIWLPETMLKSGEPGKIRPGEHVDKDNVDIEMVESKS